MFFIECHHAIGKQPGSPFSDYTWERIHLGDGHDAGYENLTDPRLAQTRDLLLARPDIIGVRVVWNAPQPTTAQPIAVRFDGQIVAQSGR